MILGKARIMEMILIATIILSLLAIIEAIDTDHGHPPARWHDPAPVGSLRHGRQARSRVRVCSILGCSKRAIVIIGIHGTNRTWAACSSYHSASLIWDIKELYPIKRGIWTKSAKGVNYDNQEKV